MPCSTSSRSDATPSWGPSWGVLPIGASPTASASKAARAQRGTRGEGACMRTAGLPLPPNAHSGAFPNGSTQRYGSIPAEGGHLAMGR